MRRIRMLMLACTITTLATHSRAESEPVSQWLMDQPVSRWDMGMMRADQSVQRAVDRMKGEMYSDSFGHVIYREERNEIDIWVHTAGFWGDPTHETCNEFRTRFFHSWVSTILAKQRKGKGNIFIRLLTRGFFQWVM